MGLYNVFEKEKCPNSLIEVFHDDCDTQISYSSLDEKTNLVQILVLDNVISQQDCDKLISNISCDPVNRYLCSWNPVSNDNDNSSYTCPETNYRVANTLETNHSALATQIFNRIKHVLPTVALVEDSDDTCLGWQGDWLPDAINSDLLIAQYPKSTGLFAKHIDGHVELEINLNSMFSVIIYLNSAPHIDLMDFTPSEKPYGQTRIFSKNGPVDILPKAGRLLIFWQHLEHSGEIATDFEKIIIRTDVLMRRNPEILTKPNDVEAFRLYLKALETSQTDSLKAGEIFRTAYKLSPGLAELHKQM